MQCDLVFEFSSKFENVSPLLTKVVKFWARGRREKWISVQHGHVKKIRRLVTVGRNQKLLLWLLPPVSCLNTTGFVISNPIGKVVTLASLGMFVQQFSQQTFCSS